MPPLAPRPFSQLARRNYRLGLSIPTGYMSGLNYPFYIQKRPRCRKRMFYFMSFLRPIPDLLVCSHCGDVSDNPVLFCMVCGQMAPTYTLRYSRQELPRGVA